MQRDSDERIKQLTVIFQIIVFIAFLSISTHSDQARSTALD